MEHSTHSSGTAHGGGHGGHGGGLKPMYIVWVWLLVVTLVEVFLAYIHVPIHIMLIALLGMSVVKAALIVAYFMHLKFERIGLVYTIVPAMVGTMLLMNVFFPDARRLSLNAIFR
jgi:cytochrome c oxidase subunit IV